MFCRISELQYKEVVNINNGERYGFVRDLELDTETGYIRQVIIPGKHRLWGSMCPGKDFTFPWSSIKRIGSDIILIDSAPENSQTRKTKL